MMSLRSTLRISLLLASASAMPGLAAAQEAPRLLVGNIGPGDSPSQLAVEVVALNPAESAGTTIAAPRTIPAHLTVDGEERAVVLACAPAQLAQGRFASLDCRLDLPGDLPSGLSFAAGSGEASLRLGEDGSAARYAFSLPEARFAANEEPAIAGAPGEGAVSEAAGNAQASAQVLVPGAMPSAKPDGGNAYLGNLSAYQPIYAVYGPGTNSEGRIQISFKYQLFGDPGDVGGDASFINGIHFGYTQRMFWDLGADSSPFRNIDFMPEIFYLQPAVEVGQGLALGGQIGLRHQSNGRAGDDSRSANTFYIQPVATMAAGDYKISLGPRLFFYVGDKEDNPDIRRYRGTTGLFAEIGQDDGFRLTAQSRYNFSSGKGALDAEVSYPLDRIVETGLNLYLFGQGFVGYGENMLDYNRRATRLRFGVSIVR